MEHQYDTLINGFLSLLKLFVCIWDILSTPFYYAYFHSLTPKSSSSAHESIRIIERRKDVLIYTSGPLGEDQELRGSLNEFLEDAASGFGDRDALGSRPGSGEGYDWMSHGEVHALSTQFSLGLRSMGLKPRDKVVIFAESSAKWLLSAFGSFKSSLTLVTIYTTLGDDGVLYCLNQTESKVIITSSSLLNQLLSILPKYKGRLQHIIYIEKDSKDKVQLNEAKHESNAKVLSFNEVLEKGQNYKVDNNDDVICRPRPEDIAVMMYTSGSTGLPKGVLLSHRNILSNVSGITEFLYRSLERMGEQKYIGYLPLAHIFELCVEIAFFGVGIPIGFSDPKCLMTRDGGPGDINVLRPTYMAMVPLVAERISKAITSRVLEKGELFKRVFEYFIAYKSKWRAAGHDTPILSTLFFRRFKGALGGKLGLIASGGAPLSPQLHEFMEIVFDLRLREGYGLTETSGGFMMGGMNDSLAGEVGQPFLGPLVKLVSWAEGEYYPGDSPCPRGEIHVGGGHIAVGYFDNQEETERHFYEEDGIRWFRTGDIGELNSRGNLRIIDRKKDIVKLQNGEYVPLGKVEAILKTHPLVDSICVTGDTSVTKHLIALLIPNEQVLNSLLEDEKNIESGKVDVYEDPRVRQSIAKVLYEHSRESLRRFEIPKGVYLLRGPWNPQNGLLTASFKLRRKAIQMRYQDVINKLIEETIQ